MKNPTKADLDHGLELVLGGKSVREVLAETSLNETQLVGHGIRFKVAIGEYTAIQGDSVTAIGAQIVKARAEGQSWGVIAFRAGLPESRIRTMFKEVSALDSRGLRNGKGGRHLADDPRFYTGSDRAKFGTELDPQKSIWDQVPEADKEQVRNLPKVAAQFAPQGNEDRKPRARKPLTEEQKAKRAAARKAKKEAAA